MATRPLDSTRPAWMQTLSTPESLLALTFAGLIVVGSLALRLPICHANGAVSFLDCIFTATSAVCVTGLTTVDTATAWSRTGQIVILVLIQTGGLGIMTFAALGAHFFRLRMSFRSRAAFEGSFYESDDHVELRRSVVTIFSLTFIIEAVGAALLYVALLIDKNLEDDPFHAVFHAISAFCNAGFSIYSANAMELRGSYVSLFTIMALIVLGGIGYGTIIEAVLRTKARLRGLPPDPLRWSLQSRVALKSSVILIVSGAMLLLVTGVAPAGDTWLDAGVQALFQSVSARTAGYNSIDIGALPLAALLVLILLMFIGGSPGSCAGGIKTTSAAVWVARIHARLQSKEDVTIGDRRIPREIVRRSALVISIATIWNLLGVFILTLTEQHTGARLEQLVFEQISAFGTVGLTANYTPSLSAPGKVWIILTMFAGRVGPLTLAVVVLRARRQPYQLPAERLLIG